MSADADAGRRVKAGRLKGLTAKEVAVEAALRQHEEDVKRAVEEAGRRVAEGGGDG